MKMRAVKKTNDHLRFILSLMLSVVIIIGGRSKKVVPDETGPSTDRHSQSGDYHDVTWQFQR